MVSVFSKGGSGSHRREMRVERLAEETLGLGGDFDMAKLERKRKEGG
jgi:hypothetical protein